VCLGSGRVKPKTITLTFAVSPLSTCVLNIRYTVYISHLQLLDTFGNYHFVIYTAFHHLETESLPS
jgi:hypothetical protein